MINRRTLLCHGSAASVGVVGGLVLPMPAAAPVELPIERVNRLAEELSLAMDDWMKDLSMPQFGKRAHWIAHVHPASYAELPIAFENLAARRSETPEQRVKRAQEELIAATKAVHPEIAEWNVVSGEDAKFDMFALIGHRKAVTS